MMDSGALPSVEGVADAPDAPRVAASNAGSSQPPVAESARHRLASIERVGNPYDDLYTAICRCGWRSRSCDSDEPYRLHAKHLEALRAA